MSHDRSGSTTTASSRSARRRGFHTHIVLAIGVLPYAWYVVLLVLVSALLVTMSASRAPGATYIPIAVPILVPPLLLLIAAVVRVRLEPPLGVRLPRGIAPTLHDLIDALCRGMRARPFDEVLLGPDLEIRTVRVPRPGWRRFDDYLVVGLPLMLALPLEHLRALLAHELAHRSRGDTTRGARVHRIRERWLHALRTPGSRRRTADLPFALFLRWFAPWYARLSFAIARDHELAADRRAALATSRTDLAGALLRLGVVERFLAERFYPAMLSDLRRYGVPPSGLNRRFENAIDGLADDARFGAWLDAAIYRDASADDAHPPLRKRLAALALGNPQGAKRRELAAAAFSPDFAGMSSARLCLAALPEPLMVTVEKVWVDRVHADLAERHEELLRLDRRRRQLENRSDLSDAEMLDHAIATAETEGPDSALPLLRELVHRNPDMAPARFVLGTLLLRRSDAEGLMHIHAAIRLDPDLEGPGREFATAFLRTNDDPGVTAIIQASASAPATPETSSFRAVG